MPKRDVVIINLLTKGKMQSFISRGLWNREVDDENIYKIRTEQLFPVGVLQIATLAAGKRSKAKTPHCNPASLRELVIKTHTLPVSPKHRMLPTGSLCVCSLRMCTVICEKYLAPVSISLCFSKDIYLYV